MIKEKERELRILIADMEIQILEAGVTGEEKLKDQLDDMLLNITHIRKVLDTESTVTTP